MLFSGEQEVASEAFFEFSLNWQLRTHSEVDQSELKLAFTVDSGTDVITLYVSM